jgi:hypothetical protein
MIGRPTSAALAAALLVAAAAPASACTLGARGPEHAIAAERYALAFVMQPREIGVGVPFAIEVVICPAPGAPVPERILVGATMPAHNHGMNYRPSVTARGPGRFWVEGLLLHMPGRWQLAFDLRSGERSDRLTFDIELP